jgi:hypothetical protein
VQYFLRKELFYVGEMVFLKKEEPVGVTEFAGREPTRAEVDQLPGPVLLEFGASW